MSRLQQFIPPLLLQPFAENAIWHGLMHKQGKGHLEIILSTEKKILTCIITDNGIGRNKAAMIKSKSEEQIFLNIEDITDDEGNAAGTRVMLKMHYSDLAEAS